MIHHLVSWKLRDGVDRAESIARTRELLIGLVGIVDSIRTIDVIENVAFPEVNHDLAVLATFDDVAGLEAFANNPIHRAAVGEIHTFITERGGIDWETPAA
jgi:hypothetical protein